MRQLRRNAGHSLVEILIVVAIIAIVMSLVVAVLSKVYRVVESFRAPPPRPATTTAA